MTIENFVPVSVYIRLNTMYKRLKLENTLRCLAPFSRCLRNFAVLMLRCLDASLSLRFAVLMLRCLYASLSWGLAPDRSEWEEEIGDGGWGARLPGYRLLEGDTSGVSNTNRPCLEDWHSGAPATG